MVVVITSSQSKGGDAGRSRDASAAAEDSSQATDSCPQHQALGFR